MLIINLKQMATIKYKNHVIHRPENVSMNMVKKICDELGQDYSFTVNDVVQLISRLSSKENVCNDVVTKIQFSNDIYERGE